MSSGERGMPLPYRVRLRITEHDDSVPSTIDMSMYAYSIFEAVMQASFLASGSAAPDNAKVKVDCVEPDLEKYFSEVLSRTVKAVTHAPR